MCHYTTAQLSIFNLCVYTCLCVCVFECLLSFSIALYLMFMSLIELGAQGLSRLASQKLTGLPVSGPPVLELQAHAAIPRLFNGGAGI